MKKLLLMAAAAALLLGAALPGLTVEMGQAFLWDGNHWAQVSEEAKAAYVFGLGNLADFEKAAAGPRKPMGLLSQALVEGLKTKTVLEVVQAVDRYYRENPGKLNTPVIEVVFKTCTPVATLGTRG